MSEPIVGQHAGHKKNPPGKISSLSSLQYEPMSDIYASSLRYHFTCRNQEHAYLHNGKGSASLELRIAKFEKNQRKETDSNQAETAVLVFYIFWMRVFEHSPVSRYENEWEFYGLQIWKKNLRVKYIYVEVSKAFLHRPLRFRAVQKLCICAVCCVSVFEEIFWKGTLIAAQLMTSMGRVISRFPWLPFPDFLVAQSLRDGRHTSSRFSLPFFLFTKLMGRKIDLMCALP